MAPIMKVALGYVAVLSLISVIVCTYDKIISKKNKVELRVPEKTLFLLSLLGGSVAMYVCMLLTRHKTKHKRFMIGIPLIIVLQIVLIYVVIYARTFLNFLA